MAESTPAPGRTPVENRSDDRFDTTPEATPATTQEAAPESARGTVPDDRSEHRPDLRIQFENARFKFRVSAVAVDHGRLLVTRVAGADSCYLAGGKVGLGETSAEAMRRELREEVGMELEIGPLLAVVETLHTRHGELRHDLELCYPVIVPEGLDPEELTRHPEEGRDLTWVPFSELAQQGFRPAELVSRIAELMAAPDGMPRHLVMTA